MPNDNCLSKRTVPGIESKTFMIGLLSMMLFWAVGSSDIAQAYDLQWSTDLGTSAYGIAIGNADNDPDGTNELVILNAEFFTIFEWDATTKTYVQQWQTSAHACPDSPKEVVIADADNDGLNEIALANHGDYACARRAYIYEWNGSTYVQQGSTPSASRATDSVAVGDVDADGSNEVVVGTTDGVYYGHVRVLEWTGTAYVEQWNYGDPVHSGYENLIYGNHVMIGDADNDGNNEILAGDYFGHIFVFDWIGSTYQTQWIDRSEGYGWNAFGLSINDVNNDGNKEIVVGARSKIGSLQWNGSSYQEYNKTSFGIGEYWSGIVVGDTDHDGNNELIAGNDDGEVFVLEWNPSSTDYTQEWSADVGDKAWGVAIGDSDNDGNVEFVVGNQAGEVFVYKRTSAPNRPSLSLPANGATDVPLTPTLQTNNFSDPDKGDTHLQTEWQMSTAIDFSSVTLHQTSTFYLTSLNIPHLALIEGTTYYWRVRFYDNHSNASEWSDVFSFTTLTTANDQNGNGIPDSQENDTVDLNDDGIPDIQQNFIKSLNTVVGDGQMGISIENASNITSIESIESMDPEDISGLARPYSMALGLFAFSLNLETAGDAVQIIVYFSEGAPSNATWYIYDSIGNWQEYSDYATFSTDRKSVTLDIQDGGFGDVDGIANGTIVDPGGFGLASWIEGYVSDGSTAQAIAFAEIRINDLVIKTMSDGYYLSMILPGTYSPVVSANGYQSLLDEMVQVPEGDVANYNFEMSFCGSGKEKIYFPHIASNGTWETEICIINAGSGQSLCGELRAYDNSGKLVDSKSISMSPKARREIIVGNEFSNSSRIGYIVLGSDSQSANGYTKFYIKGKYRVAIPAASEVNTGDIYISHIASDDAWTTGISILNTTSSSNDFIIEFDNRTTKTKTIAANEHQAFTIRELFNGNPQSFINSAVIKNGNGIVGLEIFGTTTGSGLNYLSGILLKGETSSTIYYPHIASDSTWETGIVAYNPSEMSCNLTITPYSEKGFPLLPQSITLTGKQKYIGTLDSLDLPEGTAWFSIQAASPITGFELFSTKDGNQLGGYTGVGISGTAGVFAKIDKDGGTGIAFVNIDNASATITMTAYDDSGNVVATETLNLNAYEKAVNIPSDMFSQDISAATYIAYFSSGNIVGFQLNASSDNMMLDALPGM